MTKYIQLRNQIQKLQKEAEILRKRERSETIARIKEAITAYELTAEDLGLVGTKLGYYVGKSSKKTRGASAESVAKRRGRLPKSAVSPGASHGKILKTAGDDKRRIVAPKYRDSATGTTWTGRGRQPKWLAAAIEGGKKLEDFKI
jgi:DNA-binding protein H-NS